MGEASTTRFKFPYPTGVGKVKNGPLDFKELAEQADKLAGSKYVATEQTTSSTSYVTLTTADEVELVMPTEGLIAVAYQATWKEAIGKSARAAIFLGSNQLTVATMGTTKTAEPQAAIIDSSTLKNFRPLTSFGGGLLTAGNGATGEYGTDVTTGQVVGMQMLSSEVEPSYEVGTHLVVPLNVGNFGPCYIFAAAGTYKISVKFKNTEAEATTVKNRKLWAWVVI